ncbi:hypothetical protein ZIOFF_029051 [Zingiber officinale]|uniref:Uncharacterized protein n=1 Tax=Zingiber officinale TaxID=94328 RepID=A0A8J5LE73_ZINOF|nr:hypothetical protein ZIOFF_029051 [Zingiber officinale]
MGGLGDAAGAKELFASPSDPLSNQLKKRDEKLGITEKQLEQKNLDIKKLTNETKEALAAQISAEAILRRVYANQKDEELTPIEVLIAPLQSDIKQYRNEIVMLQEDIKALERLTKSKEAALVEAESLLHNALEQARNVEVMKNKNLELKRQIEICQAYFLSLNYYFCKLTKHRTGLNDIFLQEENKILEKTYKKKVVEVEKLMKTIHELEENILAGGASANAIRDYQRKISEINEEKRMVERELARVKVSASRIATAAANEWKDDGDKVIPVKQWLEERRILQGEIQRLKDKLTLAGRTLKAETQLKEKLSLRLKTLEQCMKHSSLPEKTRDLCERKKCELASPKDLKKVSHAPNNDTVLQKPNLNSGDVDNARGMVSLNSNVVKKNSLALRSRSFNDAGKENAETNVRSNRYADDVMTGRNQVNHEVNEKKCGDSKSQNENQENGYEDMVSGFLYDKLQKKVINLRESHKDKDNVLIMKDEEIKFLLRKVDVLTKAVEVESKKKRRNAREKEMIKLENNKHNIDI